MKCLIKASYTADGAKGVIKEGGGTSRKVATDKMIREMGGKMEAFYYTSECDAYVICDLEDLTHAAAIALAIKATGLGHIWTTVLLTPEEIDKAAALDVNYRSPGGEK